MKVLLLCLCIAYTQAQSVLDNTEAQDTARTVFTSGGTYYLALNTTYLIYYGILLGLGVLALVAVMNLGGDEAQGYGHGQQSFRREGDASEEEFYDSRQKRAAFAYGKSIQASFSRIIYAIEQLELF